MLDEVQALGRCRVSWQRQCLAQPPFRCGHSAVGQVWVDQAGDRAQRHPIADQGGGNVPQYRVVPRFDDRELRALCEPLQDSRRPCFHDSKGAKDRPATDPVTQRTRQIQKESLTRGMHGGWAGQWLGGRHLDFGSY